MPKNLGQRVNKAPLLEHAHLDEKLAEPLTRLCLKLQCLLYLCVCDETAQDQDVTELLTGPTARSGDHS